MKHFKVVRPRADHDSYVPSESTIAELLGTDQTGDCVLYLVVYHALCKGFYVPDDVVKLIQSNRGVLIIDYTLESLMESSDMYVHNARHQDFINIKEQIKKYDLPAHRVILITGNLKLGPQQEFRVIHECLWRWTAPATDQQFKHEIVHDIARRKLRKHKFMCLMRRPNDSRATFAYQAFRRGWRDQGLITSWFNSDPNHSFYYSEELLGHWCNRCGQPHDPKSINNFYNSLPWMYDYPAGREEEENPNCITRGKQYQLFRDSYVNVVHETFFYHQENQLFLSEKSFKSVNMLQPFVIFGHPGSLEWMRSQGYRTFGDWWDESYDYELDDQKRFAKVLGIVEWISSRSKEYLSDMLVDQLFTLQENHRTYTNIKKDSQEDLYNRVAEEVYPLLD